MLAAALERERQKIYKQGEADGFVKGRAEGRAEAIQAQYETLLQLLRFRFDLPETEYVRLAGQLAKLQELEQLNQLVNRLLNKEATFKDFITELARYLPPDQAT